MTAIFTPVGFLVTMVIVALLLSLLVMLRISSKVADNNAILTERITSLELSAQHHEQTAADEQQPNSSSSDMPNHDLFEWFDGQMDKQRLYCQTDIDLKTTAQILGMTQRSIIQMLKTAIDAPPTFTEYITWKRLSYARKLLEDKQNWTIEAVARESGIKSDATFRRLFRKHYGMSPSEYRERKRHDALTVVQSAS